MTVRAKMRVDYKAQLPDGTTDVRLHCVYSDDPASENKAFSDATPARYLNLQIAKGKPAADQFEIAKSYYVDFTPVEP
jgi:hypothetical protein